MDVTKRRFNYQPQVSLLTQNKRNFKVAKEVGVAKNS